MRLVLGWALFAAAYSALAQSPTPVPENKTPIWRCQLPGGTYEVALRAIVSVSKHEYLVDGAARVTEVNIDTLGNMAARFYYLEPLVPASPVGVGQSAINKAQEILAELAARTDLGEVWQKVLKSYPTATHAHTIEYRIGDKDQLEKLFQSASRAFREHRDITFKAEAR